MSEQKEIVSEIERVFSLSDQAEAAIRINMIHAVHLRQSVLKHAFEGRLIPQDTNDEPASMLLDRIKTERTKGSPRRGRMSSINTNQMRLTQ